MVNLKILLPELWLEDEERSGFFVSTEIKKLWAVQLDLMSELDRVCKENGLVYFAGAGTLLGAVRHQGFIPWDDDMDFYMLRKDYDRLMQISDAFKKPYFLQNAYTDPALMRTAARLRNSDTTFITEWDESFPVNKGIFIDIFPLDGICETEWKNLVQKYKGIYYELGFKAIHKNLDGLSRKKRIKRRVANVLLEVNNLWRKNKEYSFSKYDANLKKYSTEGTEWWGNRTLVFDCPKSRRPIDDWRNIIEVPFEFTTIPIPKNYHEILTQQYGDYMQIPKNKGGGNMHLTRGISTDYAYDDPRRPIV